MTRYSDDQAEFLAEERAAEARGERLTGRDADVLAARADDADQRWRDRGAS